MKRREFIMLSLSAVVTAGAAMAQSVQELIVEQLIEQGFSEITVGRTLLGRIRIVATSAEFRREIIIHPRTGEILRDYWEALDGSAASARIASPKSSVDGSDDETEHDAGDAPEEDDHVEEHEEEDREDSEDSEEEEEKEYEFKY